MSPLISQNSAYVLYFGQVKFYFHINEIKHSTSSLPIITDRQTTAWADASYRAFRRADVCLPPVTASAINLPSWLPQRYRVVRTVCIRRRRHIHTETTPTACMLIVCKTCAGLVPPCSLRCFLSVWVRTQTQSDDKNETTCAFVVSMCCTVAAVVSIV